MTRVSYFLIQINLAGFWGDRRVVVYLARFSYIGGYLYNPGLWYIYYLSRSQR